MIGTTCSPSCTYRDPAGSAKSFCTSTTRSAVPGRYSIALTRTPQVGRLLTSQGIALGRVQSDGVPVALPQAPPPDLRRTRRPGPRDGGAEERGARGTGRPRLSV